MPSRTRRTFKKKRIGKKKPGTVQGTVLGMRNSGATKSGNLLKSGGFWGKVGRAALEAVRLGGEIKRYAIGPVSYNVADNALDDFTGPDYIVNGWYCRVLNAGLAQGDTQSSRQGNKIRVKGIKLNYRVKNGVAFDNHVRVMLIRMQHNFLEDVDPSVTTPLPPDILSFPVYRDIQILYDEAFILNPNSLSDHATVRQVYREIGQPTHYDDDSSTSPGKGTLILAYKSDQNAPSYSATFITELTYHNME